MIRVKNYQSDAVDQLLESFERLLGFSDSRICVLQAPTGSGKTIIVAEFLKRFVKETKSDRKYSFVWVSVRKLHDQSKDKLQRYYESYRTLTCSYFEDLLDYKIKENEILFINWQSINKKDINIIIRENEQDNNLNNIIQNTKDEDRDIILIVDESHHTATSEKSKELIEIIGPKITLEVSATPKLKDNVSQIVPVNLNHVKEEQMIKSEISVNPEFKNLKIGPKTADFLVIEQALKKRQELKQMFLEENSNVNPLVLIQLPDKKEGVEDKKDEIIAILAKFNITEENSRLAIWLSEDKSDTLPNIEKKNNDVEVLIFKQAIALGWDCPRASILVIFRESKSFIFTIQTMGRIMRMPELKYYSNHQELNKGFVFTNLSKIEIAEDYVKDYVTVNESKRKNNIYDDLNLTSYFLKRQRERTRLSGEFTKIFLKIAAETDLRNNIKLKPSKIIDPIISDGKIVDIDRIGEIPHTDSINFQVKDKELQYRFDKFITSCCTPFAPRDSSDRVKTALYQFLQEQCNVEKYSPEGQKIVLGKENIQTFLNAINQSKEEYKQTVVKPLGEKKLIEKFQWEVPLLISYNDKYKELRYKKSIMEPLFMRSPTEPETKFMDMLDNSEKIKWWFKNGESDKKYFAIVYDDANGLEHAFYVDFIVLFKDGTIGLFDTKGGATTEGAKFRAEGLQEYLRDELEKGKKLDGGIVIFENGSFWINRNREYSYNPNNLSDGWQILFLSVLK